MKYILASKRLLIAIVFASCKQSSSDWKPPPCEQYVIDTSSWDGIDRYHCDDEHKIAKINGPLILCECK